MKKKAKAAIEAYSSTGEDTDVLGSYTGIYRDQLGRLEFGLYPSESMIDVSNELPVQDADDL